VIATHKIRPDVNTHAALLRSALTLADRHDAIYTKVYKRRCNLLEIAGASIPQMVYTVPKLDAFSCFFSPISHAFIFLPVSPILSFFLSLFSHLHSLFKTNTTTCNTFRAIFLRGVCAIMHTLTVIKLHHVKSSDKISAELLSWRQMHGGI